MGMRGEGVEKRGADAGPQISTEGGRGREEEEGRQAMGEGRAQGKHNKQQSQNNGCTEHPHSHATHTIVEHGAGKLR